MYLQICAYTNPIGLDIAWLQIHIQKTLRDVASTPVDTMTWLQGCCDFDIKRRCNENVEQRCKCDVI